MSGARNARRVRAGLAALAAGLLCGCATPRLPRHDAWRATRPEPRPAGELREQCVRALACDLLSLGPSVSVSDAQSLARTAVEGAGALREDYASVRPAWLNNVLVNMGLRRRGLCYHWADDLGPQLLALNLTTLRLYRAVARHGRFNEHSGHVVTAEGQPFDGGIILDAWRYGGTLFWDFVRNDRHRYPWILIDEECRVRSPVAALNPKSETKNPGHEP